MPKRACQVILVLLMHGCFIAAYEYWIKGATPSHDRLFAADPASRLEAVRSIPPDVKRAETRFVALLAEEHDRDVLEAAAEAAVRIGDPSCVDVLLRRASAGPDDQARAAMILAAARLDGGSSFVTGELITGLNGGETWRRVGCALGLMEAGEPIGVDQLLVMLPSLDEAQSAFATHHLNRVLPSTATIVGAPLDESILKAAPGNEAAMDRVRAFWALHGQAPLLRDTLSRLDTEDWHRRQVGRLIEARHRLKKWVNSPG